jgi:hypothetical protein
LPPIWSPSAVKESADSLTPEIDCIDGYFTYFHPLVPLVDEAGFRHTYNSGRRKDSQWLALLSIVCALGSIAATSNQDKSHSVYYARCKYHLGLDALGSPHLETVQTLGLMGELYLRYISQPNLAYPLMGAAQRLALAQGLHEDRTLCREGTFDPIDFQQVRRRVWWSLFCMDTWACGPLDRPGISRFGPTHITVNLVSRGDEVSHPKHYVHSA